MSIKYHEVSRPVMDPWNIMYYLGNIYSMFWNIQDPIRIPAPGLRWRITSVPSRRRRRTTPRGPAGSPTPTRRLAATSRVSLRRTSSMTPSRPVRSCLSTSTGKWRRTRLRQSGEYLYMDFHISWKLWITARSTPPSSTVPRTWPIWRSLATPASSGTPWSGDRLPL